MRSLNARDYEGDEKVRVHGAGREAWLSERLFQRLVLIGAAYDLHRLPLLGEDTALNPVQADGLLSELDFVGGLVADAALASLLTGFAPVVSACRASAQTLFIEWP